MSEELKPCPFCGGEPRIREFVGATEIHCCNKCSERPRIRIASDDIRSPTYEQAIAAWNRRASPSTEGEGGEEMTRAIRIAENVLQSKRSHAAFAVTLARALLSSPDARRKALEEAAKCAETCPVLDNKWRSSIAFRIRALKETKP